jgi:putative ABC transport system substrate-binding protein
MRLTVGILVLALDLDRWVGELADAELLHLADGDPDVVDQRQVNIRRRWRAGLFKDLVNELLGGIAIKFAEQSIAPHIRQVAMLFNPDTAPGGGRYYLGDFEAAARSSRVQPIAARAQSDAEIEAVVTSLGREPDGGLIVMPDFFMLNHVWPILLKAARSNVPTIFPWRYVVTKEGGLISYGPDFRDIVRRAAPYVDRILRGDKPADLPVQVPVKFEMAVNVKTAKSLGLAVPTSLLMRADEVIE